MKCFNDFQIDGFIGFLVGMVEGLLIILALVILALVTLKDLTKKKVKKC